MNLDQAKITFIDESRELLAAMEDVLLRAEREPCDEDAINALFRCAHTIKGSAGLFGFDPIVHFMHVVESVLDRVRNGEVVLGSGLIGLLLECRDHAEQLLSEVAERGTSPDALAPNGGTTGEALAERLGAYLGKPKAQPSVSERPAASVPLARADPVERIGSNPVESDAWHISLRFGPDVFRFGMDPQSFLRYLSELGTVEHVETLLDALPPAAEMDPETCYLGFHVRFKSSVDKATIEAVFEFVRDQCQIRIVAPHSKLEEYIRLIEELPEDPMRLGEMLLRSGALTPYELDQALAAQSRGNHGRLPATKTRLGEILVASQLAPEPAVSAALEKQKAAEEKRLQAGKFVKVPADRLDSLINLVGELVIAGAGAGMLAARERNSAQQEANAVVMRLVEEVRDCALRLRMVPVGDTFSRFPRLVRDVAKELGKEIELAISGADTELDKSMVEHLGDPLMHLVRNAIDHGIEPSDQRQVRGKPAKGTVKLNAYHDSGSIVIEVSDDGGGLDLAKIRAKAIEKELLDPDAKPTEAELFRLVLAPGFSTAASVTSLSGRGVGMDVVKRNIEALRGTIEIVSTSGEGSTFRLRMPLTLAIIDGFLVKIDQASYVIPLDMVVECTELAPESRNDAGGRNYTNLRGEVLPFLRLREVFEADGAPPARENIVVVKAGTHSAGLVVDHLLGELQAVIKPLSTLFRHIKGISGSTVLGDGDVALILDVPALVESAVQSERRGAQRVIARV